MRIAFPYFFRTALEVKNLANRGKITPELLKVINFSHFLGKTFDASKKCY